MLRIYNHYRTESNIDESSDNDIDKDDSVLEESIDVQNDGDDEDDIQVDLPRPKTSSTIKTKSSKKPTFEDNLINFLENQRPQDAETFFLMSLLP